MREKFNRAIKTHGESCRLIYKSGGEGESYCIKRFSGAKDYIKGEALFFLPASESHLQAGDKIVFRGKEYNILAPEGVAISGEELYIRVHCGSEKEGASEIIISDGSLKFKGVAIAYKAGSLETIFAQQSAEFLTSEGKGVLQGLGNAPRVVRGSGTLTGGASLAELRALFSMAESGTLIVPQIGGIKAHFTKLWLKDGGGSQTSYEFEFVEDCV